MTSGIARLIMCLAVCAAAGCSSGLSPWQRGYLAEPGMQFDGESVSARLERQYYFSREAARGGQSFGGTGCGCN
jgi:hypothetical protein